MKLTIDNLDGKGALDYSVAMVSNQPLRIARKLNEPSVCNFTLAPSALGLAVPLRHGRVIVADDNGVVLFTGYIATEPAHELAGQSFAGLVYQCVVAAISDELLLDQQPLVQAGASYSQTAAQLMESLVGRTGYAGISTDVTLASDIVGRFLLNPGQSWAENAGTLSLMARSAYRVQNSTLSLSPVGTVVHTLNEADGTLQIAGLEASMAKVLANDITVCGENEPGAYVTEFFQGDGTTVLFDLTREPYFPSTSKEKPLIDLFQEASVNQRIWQLNDSGSRISITSTGLTCTGGDGIDGDTNLTYLSQIELGGGLVFEANGVQFGATTVGVINGLYNGIINIANCIAGFHLEMVNGNTVMVPVINGTDSGSSFSSVSGHMYTLRLRIYTNELQRVLQSYYVVDDSGPQRYGGDFITTGASVVMEVQDMTDGVVGAPTILYSGTIGVLSPTCLFALLNSTSLQCSIASIYITQEGPNWVTSTPSGGNPIVRRLGTTAQGAECKIERTGKLRFYPANVPQAGEMIAISYRTAHRAVGRIASASSIASESASGLLPGTSQWIGTVTSPAARSSADCENAAKAILDLATSRAAAWKGKYVAWNIEAQSDIWPGDVLSINSDSANMHANLVVRAVEIDMLSTAPGQVKYTISFANDWADNLSIHTSSTVPTDTWLPDSPQTASPLASLDTLSVTSITGTTIQITAGATPPASGGFEVRRRDWSFGPGSNSDLVLRSPVANFSIPRASAVEQFYIRMYDGATPPNYSRFSSAIFVNVPL